MASTYYCPLNPLPTKLTISLSLIPGATYLRRVIRASSSKPVILMSSFNTLKSSIQHPTADLTLPIVVLSRGDHGTIGPKPHRV